MKKGLLVFPTVFNLVQNIKLGMHHREFRKIAKSHGNYPLYLINLSV